MPLCPSCQRAVAVARPTCVYCGAPLPVGLADEIRAAARAATEPVPSPAVPGAPERTLVVIDLDAVTIEALAHAAERSRFEATLLTRRRGLWLHRVLAPEPARSEAARLAAAGVPALLVPESEARLRPQRAQAGELTPTGLVLRTEEGSVVVSGEALLIVVSGPIVRQRQASSKRPKVATATLEEGFCIHLHRLADERPLEIDAGRFEPGFAVAGSTRLQLEAWLQVLAEGVPRDDGFRWLAPALAPAETPVPGPLAALESLSQRSGGQVGSPRERDGDERLLLDNLEQFRFYSGWRGAAERRRVATAAPGRGSRWRR
jgi:hypothetical protein